jgi:outer membrane protein assembly factor BamB
MRTNWILIDCVVILVLLSLVLRAAGDDKTEQLAETSVRSDAASAKEFLRNWPSFRGPNAVGHAAHANPPLQWNVEDGTGILWKIALPKHGMSSPIAWGNRIFLTGADDDSRQLYCVDADSGKLLWQHDVNGVPGSPDDGKIPEVLDETGFAAPTSTTDGQYVAAIFATGELVCVNLAGKRIWIKHLGIPQNHYGHTSSLLCHDNLLFVQYDQKENSQLLAFELASGQPVWQAKRGAMSWSSPILAEINGRMELILTNSKAVEGYDPTSGKRLWRVECLDGEVASSAAYANGTVFVANEGAPASAIDLSSPERKTLWQGDEAEVLPDSASPVANDKYLIVPTAFGVVRCLAARTGKVLWEQEFDQGFRSSPILVNDRVYIIDLSGMMQIFRMDQKFELLGAADVGEPVYATPAFIEERIYVRSLGHLFCIRAVTK